MSVFDFDAIAAELGAAATPEGAEAMLNDDNERIRDRMESRRAIMQAQVRSDEIKSKLCDKIQEEKKKVPGLKEKISSLEDSDPELFKYIRKLEFIQDGIWCPRCNVQKSIGGRKQDSNVGITPQTEYDVNALHAYESAVIEKLRSDYNAFEDKIMNAFEGITEAQRNYTTKFENSMKLVSALSQDLVEMQERAKHIAAKIGQAPNVFMQPPLDTLSQSIQLSSAAKLQSKTAQMSAQMQTQQTQQLQSPEKINYPLPAKPSYNLDTIVEETYSQMTASDLLGDD